MGKSYTYHVIGYCADGKMVCAMSKTEMAQHVHKLAKYGQSVASWIAQTKVGCRILRCPTMFGEPTPGASVKLPKLSACPICRDCGCCVCNYSGICKPGYWNNWQPWQIERLKKEYAHVSG